MHCSIAFFPSADSFYYRGSKLANEHCMSRSVGDKQIRRNYSQIGKVNENGSLRKCSISYSMQHYLQIWMCRLHKIVCISVILSVQCVKILFITYPSYALVYVCLRVCTSNSGQKAYFHMVKCVSYLHFRSQPLFFFLSLSLTPSLSLSFLFSHILL